VTDAASPPPPVDPTDEWLHPDGGDRWWNESWYFDFASPDGSIGGYARIGRYPNQGVVWYWAAIARPDEPLVLVREHEVVHPRHGGLEIRHEGLWADHHIEEPLDRWSLGLEAFAVTLDQPADAFHGELGHRTALGFDLEWETTGAPYPYPGVDRYEIPCRVHGEVLVGDETITIDAPGERDHSWGSRDWWTFGWWWTTFHTPTHARHGMRLDHAGVDFHAGFVTPTGTRATASEQETMGFTATEVLDDEQLLEQATMTYGDEEWTVEPIAHAPVILVDDQEGRVSRFSRCYARWTSPDGDTGTGWYERNLPQR